MVDLVKRASPLGPPSSTLGLYIHIPFCRARCGYCDFVAFTGKENQQDRYTRALCREIEFYAGHSPSTVFFGGGTPSVLEPHSIRAMFKSLHTNFEMDGVTEITLEANPESMTPEKLDAWREVGVNRLSIGLQAYDDGFLKSMGRLHTVQQFESNYQNARRAGFSNLSIDLIYGFPDQTLGDWEKTLTATVALKPEHLSIYALVVEEHTPFAVSCVETDPDLQAAMYAAARSYLPGFGYGQYEISNFARPGKECRHNLIYWRGQDYVGLGAGAVGCIEGLRWENQKNLTSYYKDIAAGRRPRLQVEMLDASTRRFERLMLGLRLREGFSWGAEKDAAWQVERNRLASRGFLEEMRPGVWRIPEMYVPLTNQILLPFLPA